MDPTTCYKDMLTAFYSEDFIVSSECAYNLEKWLIKGGFWPVGYSKAEVLYHIVLAGEN